MSGGLSFVLLSAGRHHACGLTSDGAAHCWGRNQDGQLGDGSGTDSPIPVAVSGGLSFESLSSGRYHTCGVTGRGVTYCWGYNEAGQLSDGTLVLKRAPTPVSPPQQ